MPEDIRGWLAGSIGRRPNRPALEQTLFNQLDALERGPLEQLGALVRTVVDELRLAQQRLNEQAADLRALRATVVSLNARLESVAARVPEDAAAEPPVPDGHVLLLPTPDGYRLVERDGPLPPPGEVVEHEGRSYRLLGRGASPLPGDRRPCATALP